MEADDENSDSELSMDAEDENRENNMNELSDRLREIMQRVDSLEEENERLLNENRVLKAENLEKERATQAKELELNNRITSLENDKEALEKELVQIRKEIAKNRKEQLKLIKNIICTKTQKKNRRVSRKLKRRRSRTLRGGGVKKERTQNYRLKNMANTEIITAGGNSLTLHFTTPDWNKTGSYNTIVSKNRNLQVGSNSIVIITNNDGCNGGIEMANVSEPTTDEATRE